MRSENEPDLGPDAKSGQVEFSDLERVRHIVQGNVEALNTEMVRASGVAFAAGVASSVLIDGRNYPVLPVHGVADARDGRIWAFGQAYELRSFEGKDSLLFDV